MIAKMTKKKPGAKRDRKQKFDQKRLAEIAATLEKYAGRVHALKESMRTARVAYIEFDGASGIDRAIEAADLWCRLATFDLLGRRGDMPELN